MEFSRRLLLYMSFFTLFGLSIFGWLIIWMWHDASFSEILIAGMPIPQQLAYGLAYGTGAALIGASLVRIPFFRSVTGFFKELFKSPNIGWPDFFFVAVSAGVGEEILFRGAIQPFLGIWITSILFILIHGYLDPRRPAWMILGILMIFLSAGLGYLFEYVGLISAMVAHFIYDLITIYNFRRMIDADQKITAT